MNLFRNIIYIIIAPKVGWEDVNLASTKTSDILSKAFFPLLAILAIAGFVPMIWDSTITLGYTLAKTIVEVAAYLLTYYISSILISGIFPELAKTKAGVARVNDFCLYNIMFLIMLMIMAHILPIDFTPIYFLMMYLPYIVIQGTDYLGVKKEKVTAFVIVSSALMLLTPLLITHIFSIVIK